MIFDTQNPLTDIYDLLQPQGPGCPMSDGLTQDGRFEKTWLLYTKTLK